MHVLSLDNNIVSIETERKPNYMLRVFLIALGISTIIFLPSILKGNGIYNHYGDYIYQQIPFYQLCHDAIRTGQLGFNLFTDSGVDFIGSYSYYSLFSPFFWLTLPFPNDWVPYLMGPLFVLKFSVMAVTGYSYINMFVKNPNTAIVGGLLYSFCGFNIYNIVFNVFVDVAAFFPLLLISMEKFVKEDKKYFFALAVCFSCLLNYFFFYGQVIFCVIYFFVRINYDDFNVDLKKFLNLALEAVLGLLLACFLLIPSLLILVGNDRASDYIKFDNWFVFEEIPQYGVILMSMFFPPDPPGFYNIFTLDIDIWSSTSEYLPFFSMTGVLAFFKYKKKHFAKTLLIICGVICFIPILNSTFSAFNSNYYSRWYYMPILIMALATMLVLEENLNYFKYGIKITAICSTLFFILGVIPAENKYGVVKWFGRTDRIEFLIDYSLIILISLIFLFLLINTGMKDSKFYLKLTSMVSLVIVLYTMFILNFAFVDDIDFSNYELEFEEKELLTDKFYRINTSGTNKNLGMYLKLPSITSFHSLRSPSILYFYEMLGTMGESVTSTPPIGKVGIGANANVLFAVIEQDVFSEFNDYESSELYLGYRYLGIYNDFIVLKNDYFVPFGVGYDYQFTQSQFDQVEHNSDRLLVAGVHLGYEYNLLPPIETDSNGDYLSDEQYLINCETLAQNSLQNLELDSYGFTGVYETDRDQILYISLPYTKGFTAMINGEQVDIMQANFGFMAIPVQAGVNYVEFKYETPGLRAGLIISFIALVLFIGYVYLTRRGVSKVSDTSAISATSTTEETQVFTEEVLELDEIPTETSVVEEQELQENLEKDVLN